jgi:hypothetical protein
MAENKEGDSSSPDDDQKRKDTGAEKQPVAKTRLDINIGDLIDPLTAPSQNVEDEDVNHRKVAKTLLEKDGPSLERIKELSESARHAAANPVGTGQAAANPAATNPAATNPPATNPASTNPADSGRHTVPKTLLDVNVDFDVDSMSPEEFKAYKKQLSQTMPDPRKESHDPSQQKSGSSKSSATPSSKKATAVNANESPARDVNNVPVPGTSRELEEKSVPLLKELAKTIPESETEPSGDGTAGDGVSLKALAKTLPDPPMQERKAVAARIARIRSFQKTQTDRKFSKTMAESNFEVLDSLRESSAKLPQQLSSNASAQSDSMKGESKTSGSGKTGPAQDVSGEAKDFSKAANPAESPKKRPARREQFVIARTRLDHDILIKAVSDSKVREEARVAAIIEEKAKEPPKPPPVVVKADKTALACPFVWDEVDATEKFKYCAKCQTPIYNLDGMERPEAEALIFNRENRAKFTLYGRADGKFMTTDCPVQAQRKKNLLFSVLAGLVLLTAAGALILMMPPPPAAVDTPGSANSTGTTDSTNTDTSGDSTNSDSNTSFTATPTKDANGMITFSSDSKQRPAGPKKSGGNRSAGGTANGGYQTFKLPNANPQSSQAHDPDEDGHFWKFE